MANENFEGFVLFKRPYREKDSLVKIFTNKYGTKMFFVKGLQKPNHSLTSSTLPITLNNYIGTIKENGLSFLKEGSSLNVYPKIQMDLYLQAYASYIVQLVDAAVEDNSPDPATYNLLKIAISRLTEDLPSEIICNHTEIHLLKNFGTHINWKACQICGDLTEPFKFSVNYQGVLCKKHWNEDPYIMPTSPRAVHIAKNLSLTTLDNIQSINVSQQTIKELRQLLDTIYQEFVGIRLKSHSYLQKIKQMDDSIQALAEKRNKNKN